MKVFYKNREIDVSEEAYRISEKGKYSIFSEEIVEILKTAVGNAQFTRDFSCGYSNDEYNRLVEKHKEVVRPIHFEGSNSGNIVVTFSDFKEFRLGAFNGYHISKRNNIRKVCRGDKLEITKEELLLGLKRGLREEILFNKQFRKTVKWRGEYSARSIKEYKSHKRLLESIF